MPWQKGDPRNKGRPPLNAELRELRKESREGLIKLIEHQMNMTKTDEDHYFKSPHRPKIERIIRSVLSKAEITGEFGDVRFLLEVLCGKLVDDQELEATDAETKEILAEIERLKTLPHEEVLRIATDLKQTAPEIKP